MQTSSLPVLLAGDWDQQYVVMQLNACGRWLPNRPHRTFEIPYASGSTEGLLKLANAHKRVVVFVLEHYSWEQNWSVE